MITYEDAYKKALELKPGIDACDEYDKAYLFKRKADKFNIGGDSPCVILKDTGDAINDLEFYENYRPKFVKEVDMK